MNVAFRSECRHKKGRFGRGPDAAEREVRCMTYHTKIVGNKQDVGCDWTGRSYDAPEREPVTLVSDHECARRAVERAKMRCSYRHCVRIMELSHPEASRAEIERRAKREWRRNLNMVRRNEVHYERLNETPATVRIDVKIPVLPSRPVGHAPRTARHSTRSSASNSSNDSDDSDGGSDSPEPPSTLPRNCGGHRNESRNEQSHKYRTTDLLDKLQLASAALMFAVLASLIMGCSR